MFLVSFIYNKSYLSLFFSLLSYAGNIMDQNYLKHVTSLKVYYKKMKIEKNVFLFQRKRRKLYIKVNRYIEKIKRQFYNASKLYILFTTLCKILSKQENLKVNNLPWRRFCATYFLKTRTHKS